MDFCHLRVHSSRMKRVGLVEQVFVTVNLLKQLLELKKKN